MSEVFVFEGCIYPIYEGYKCIIYGWKELQPEKKETIIERSFSSLKLARKFMDIAQKKLEDVNE